MQRLCKSRSRARDLDFARRDTKVSPKSPTSFANAHIERIRPRLTVQNTHASICTRIKRNYARRRALIRSAGARPKDFAKAAPLPYSRAVWPEVGSMCKSLKTVVAVLIAIVACGSLAVYGQDRSGPAQPPLWLPDDEYLRWPLSPSEQAYASLSGRRIKGYINEITAISRRSRDDGNQYWGRITGTAYDRMTAEWVAAQFRRIGLEQVRVQTFETLPPQWFPTSWDVSVAGAGKTIALKTAFTIYHSAGIASTDLDPVWAGLGLPADFLGRDVKGKAVLVYGIPTPGGRSDSALSNGAVQRAEEAGAAGLVIIPGFPRHVTSPATG